MNNKGLILTLSVLFLLILNLCAGVLVKVSPLYYSRPVLLVTLVVLIVGIYGIQTLMWLFLGKDYQLSYIYSLLSVNYVFSVFVGMAVFHEPFMMQRLVGAAIIFGGVVLASCSKHRNESDNGGDAV